MPPFAGTTFPATAGVHSKRSESHIITLNVGGQLFQTTAQTLAVSGPKSILTSLASSAPVVPFIDRDPALFSLLLSLLRTGRLPSVAFDPDDLLAEARFYGVHSLLVAALSGPSRFDPFALSRSVALPLHGRDAPSAVAASSSGAVLAAHGGKITTFDPSLRRRSTILTRLPAIDSLLPLPSSLAAAGATDFPGLQILDLDRGSVVQTLDYAGSTVQAIGSSLDFLFGSFESCRRNASAIVAFDLNTLQPIAEIGRQEIYGAELDSAIPATKLNWVSGLNFLMASGSHSGPSGLQGNLRLWDVRSGGSAVWEVREKADCFADVTVSNGLSAIFKVGMNSGDVYMSDLRKLSKEEPWVCLTGDGTRGGGRREGSGCRMESHGGQVFCSRGGEVEMWTEVAMGGSPAIRREDGLDGERVMRRNLMGRAKDAGGSRIVQMGFGGNRMVLARKEEHCVEVWESSVRA